MARPLGPWHGFAIEIKPDTDLGGEGFLILEHAEGGYEPVACVSTVNEAQEIAADRFRTSNCNDCIFKVWARGIDGRFLTVPVVIDGRRIVNVFFAQMTNVDQWPPTSVNARCSVCSVEDDMQT